MWFGWKIFVLKRNKNGEIIFVRITTNIVPYVRQYRQIVVKYENSQQIKHLEPTLRFYQEQSSQLNKHLDVALKFFRMMLTADKEPICKKVGDGRSQILLSRELVNQLLMLLMENYVVVRDMASS